MNVFLLVTFVVLFVVLIIILPVKVKVSVHANLMRMEGYYLIHAFVINIVCGKVFFENDKLRFDNKINLLKSTEKSKPYTGEFYKEVSKRVKVVNFNYFKSFGNNEDAFETAQITAIENMVVNTISAILKTRYNYINIFSRIIPTFTRNENNTTIYAVIKISIFDVIISFFKAKLKIKEKQKLGKEKQNV